MSQELQLPFPGSIVRARGRSWRVVDATRHGECGVCRLVESGSAWPRHLALLVPFDRVSPVAPDVAPMRVKRRRLVHELRCVLLEATDAESLRAAVRGRFRLMPYQLEPALAVLRGETRLLIGDEVGLGKTVQAALILAEVFSRDPAARCLVAAPASLCPQWVAELRGRFGLPALHVDRTALRRLACLLPPGSAVWDRQPLPVASFDFIKRPEVASHVARLRWDALVVDEAHMVSLAPERSAALTTIAARARRLVLLTATPYASDAEGFRALCDMGHVPGEAPILVLRRGRAELGIAARRKNRLLLVRLTPAERRMHAELDRYTGEVWRQRSVPGRPDARLAMIVLRKRAASGPAALLLSLSRRLSLLEIGETADASQLSLPLEPGEEGDAADDEPLAILAAPGLRDLAAERTRLTRLVHLATLARSSDSKLAALRRLLRRAREPVIVFTEYRDTLARLAAQLAPVHTLALLHGGLGQSERQSAIRAFTEGAAQVLLATDAAAHGLNLQARCRLVVHVELPWMPSRLEQRAGRVDRIGQQRTVHVVHLVARRTSEENVLARLLVRVERERAELGHSANPFGSREADELTIARGVFEGTLPPRDEDASGEPGGRRLNLRTAAETECSRLQALRALVETIARRGPHTPSIWRCRPAWTVVRKRRGSSELPRGLVCVFAARFVDGRGSLVTETAIVIHVSLAVMATRRPTLERLMPELLAAARSRIQRAASAQAEKRLSRLRDAASARLEGPAVREAAIGEQIGSVADPIQAGLFDRRAVRQAHEQQQQRAADGEEAARRLETLNREGSVQLAGQPELVLVIGVAL